jgi:hypothetical protein
MPRNIAYDYNFLFSIANKLCDFIRFEVFTAVTMKNGVFWDVHHPDEGGAKFLRNVRSYKSHTA